ncbi:prepilin peptidase [Halomonas halocynthiae]|uniref:prepilin peptidase n=1 Tax=Halomonas halocynthiae TaxID=176290 RepID=UPI00040B9501|nr:A24 family peptidase [Halomonas halocynthiae]
MTLRQQRKKELNVPLNSPNVLLWGLTAVLGLCIGSFLNVVIYRLPKMMAHEWQKQAHETLGSAMLEQHTKAPLNLLRPPSRCPDCHTPIAWHDNLPLLGWLKRRGRCAHCGQQISLHYPLVELASALIALATLAVYGATLQSLFIAGACFTLLALAVIDARTQLLPDTLTLPLLWAGLLYQVTFHPSALDDAVIGAMLGYLLLWSLYWLFKLATGKEGMGYGDFKLLAALGAWLGWQYLPTLLLISAGIGAVAGVLIQHLSPELRGKPLPFGPWLALAGWLALLTSTPLLTLFARISP